MASPLPNGSPFGVPISQVQPNYVYVPSVTLSQQHLGNAAAVAAQTVPKIPNHPHIIEMSKYSNVQPPTTQQHHELQLASLELNIQPNPADSILAHPSLQQNFQLVAQQPTVLSSENLHSFEENIQEQPLEVMEGDGKEPVKTEIEESDVEKIRSSLAEVKETSHIWKAVRERILSQCRLWDLLLDKASFSYFYDAGEAQNEPKDNLRKFGAVIKEVEDLLGEFKCFMDACLQEDNDTTMHDGLCLGPELSRAYEVIPGKVYTIKGQDSISSFYRAFFTSNEVLNKDLTLNLPFMEDRVESNEDSDDENQHYDHNNQEDLDDDSEKKPHVCQGCGKSYSRHLNLAKHYEKCSSQLVPMEHCQWHKRSLDGRIVCDFNHCRQDFSEMISLWTHFQEEHALPGDYIFRCTECQLVLFIWKC